MPHQKVYPCTCTQILKEQKLYSEVVPKTVDEYLSYIKNFIRQKRSNFKSCMACHNGAPPKEKL